MDYDESRGIYLPFGFHHLQREEPAAYDIRASLEALWSRTERQTRDEHPRTVALLEAIMDLFRTGLISLHGSDRGDDYEQLRMELLNSSASVVEAGYLVGVRGHYQACMSCTRMLVEQLALIHYFRRFPDQAVRARQDDLQIGTATAIAQMENREEANALNKTYDVLSGASHPRLLGRMLGLSDWRLRVNAFESGYARMSLGMLVDVGMRLLVELQDEVQRVGTNEGWIVRLGQVARQYEHWCVDERAFHVTLSPPDPDSAIARALETLEQRWTNRGWQ